MLTNFSSIIKNKNNLSYNVYKNVINVHYLAFYTLFRIIPSYTYILLLANSDKLITFIILISIMTTND